MYVNMEVWKDIIGYEGYYEVSNLGRVKSLRREYMTGRGGLRIKEESILKQTFNNRYLVVNLCVNGVSKARKTHSLVAESFLNHFSKGKCDICVDHIDNNQLNNDLSNLQIVSARTNNSKDKIGKTSKYTGVSWKKSIRKWVSQIHVNGKKIHIGVFENELDAYKSYLAKMNIC